MTANETSILTNVNRILAKQNGTRTWGAKEHNILLSLVAEDCGLDVASKKDFRDLLAVRGLGGNSSQFRQWLQSKDGGELIPKTAVVDATYADL